MHTGRKNKEADYKMKVNQDEYSLSIAKCNKEKDPGVIFDKSINKADKIIGIIKRTFTCQIKKFSITSTKPQFSLIWSMVM